MGKSDAKPLRSLLFTPGDQAQRIAENVKSGADALFLDLEEPRTPCPEWVRVQARGLVGEFLSDAPNGPGAPVYFVRVQPVASGMILRDLNAVMGPNLTGILLPKITGPADVYAADAILGCVETEFGIPVGNTLLYPILKNASAIRGAFEIATASERVAYMGGAVSRFGDIAGDIGFRWTRTGTETLFIREKVLIDARAAGIRYPISGMWGGANDDAEGLNAWLTELGDIGYFGMMLGNREHVDVVNAAFTPTPAEIAYWQDLDRLATEAERALTDDPDARVIYGDVNQGEGHEIHIAHVATARKLLAWARELAHRMTTKAAEVRAGLSHPIIDADGHFVEVAPLLNEEMLTYLEEMGGREVRDRYALDTGLTDTSTVLAGHRGADGSRWDAMPSWWGWATANTLDRATAHLPALLYERLDEFGIDYTILYPSMTLSYLEIADDELIGLRCRAANRALANLFAPYRDRTTVGALVPMLDPKLAADELEYAVRELGFKTAVFAGHARRPIGGLANERGAYRLDTFGIDSAFDYDPVWAKCVELGVAPVFHSSLQSHRVTRSATNYAYNHIGGLAASHESLCKSLFLSGVTHRFPTLRFGFLEGGVAWACSLLGDLVGHWEKRNARAIRSLDPDLLDVDALLALLDRYGDDRVRSGFKELRDYFTRPSARPAQLDEFAAAALESIADLHDRFVPSFYFGCEADDRLVTWAFDERVNAACVWLRPIFGSDISHWDVPDMTEPVAEAFELVEAGLLDDRAFRELMFLNPVRLHAGMNPAFFDGTVCETAVHRALPAS